jgi:hypothetical protein
MEFTILHRGVPLGTVELPSSDLAIGELAPSPAYLAVREEIREASAALWALGFLSESPLARTADPSSLARAQALPLELRDPAGTLVTVDFINIVERPDAADAPVVFTRFRHAAAIAPAAVRRQPRAGGEKSRPDT